MYDDPLMKVKNVIKASKHIGRDIANDMNIPIKELKEYIKPKEIASILKQYSIKKNGDFMINSVILKRIFSEVKNWIIGIQLAKLASSGEIDTIWDEEQNCMVFKTK